MTTPAQPDPAAQLRAAAENVRNGNAAIAESNLAWTIAEWLDATADYCTVSITHPTHVARAMAVARALLGSSDG